MGLDKHLKACSILNNSCTMLVKEMIYFICIIEVQIYLLPGRKLKLKYEFPRSHRGKNLS